MNPNPGLPPSDPDIDRLLGSQLKRTSPEFEQRWRELRGELVKPARTAFRWPSWLLWPGIATAAAAAAAVAVFTLRQPPPATEPPRSVIFEELIALDAALTSASPLLVAENREALLNLPATNL